MVVATIGFSLTSIICGLFGYVAFNNLRLSREIEARISFEGRLGAVIGELNHRVKNILAVIQSIATRTLRDGADVRVARELLIGRIHAMSHVVSLLSDSDWQGVRLRSLLESSLSPALKQVNARGPDMTIGARAAQSLSLLLFELGSFEANGHEGSAPRSIELEWSTNGEGADAKFNLRWQEQNTTRDRRGAEDDFSDVLLDRVVPEALGGVAKRYFVETTYVYELSAPLSVVIDQAEIDRTTRLLRPV
jgi:two-component sensor histidine kinase